MKPARVFLWLRQRSYQPCLVIYTGKSFVWSLFSPKPGLPEFPRSYRPLSHDLSFMAFPVRAWLFSSPTAPFGEKLSRSLQICWAVLAMIWCESITCWHTCHSSPIEIPHSSLLYTKKKGVRGKKNTRFSPFGSPLNVTFCLLFRFIYMHWHIRKVTSNVKYRDLS